jgi:uncharacterized protein GlcG (DUF336 family)
MRRIFLLSGMTMSLILSASVSSLAQLAPAALFTACQTTAAATPSALRGAGKFTKMWCAVVDREGQLMLIKATDTAGTPSAPASSDAWRGSIEIAIAKAFTALAFSSSDQALDSRTLGLLTRIDGPGSKAPKRTGTDTGVAPLFGIGDSNPYRPLTGSGLGNDDATGIYHHGLITFAGGQPVYDCSTHALLGAVGVSGDGVDQDDTVAKGAITGAGVCLTP